MPYSIIAIDGPAASGKSSVGRLVARELGFLFVSSGHYYRALAWIAYQAHLDLSDHAAVSTWLETLSLESHIVENAVHIFFKNHDLSPHLNDPEVTHLVSLLAAVPAVRSFLLLQQRALANKHDLVMEGRDIGSVVFSNTPFKFYLDASPEERLKRRACQGISDVIAERDHQDTTRATAPLIVAPGAIVIDTTMLTIPEVAAVILAEVQLP